MYVDFNDIFEYIPEVNLFTDKVTASSKLLPAKGILIEDSYNNPFFPVTPEPKLDTSKIDMRKLVKNFISIYGSNISFLPWHYCIELISNDYYVFNTRPIIMKFPMSSKEARHRKNQWNYSTKLFMDEKIYDINEAIHVCIVGDTSSDVYTRKFYETLGKICIHPIMSLYRLPGLNSRVFGLNLGSNFNFSYLEQFSF